LTFLQHIQARIERIYNLTCLPRVEAFLMAQNKDGTEGRDHQSKVWVMQEDQSLYLGLYFAPHLQQKLKQSNAQWSVAEYCEVVEEVSHFIYLSWSAAQEHTVTQIDLELQAEIDKFLLLSLPHSPRPWLLRMLFEQIHYRPDLNQQEQFRYQCANRLAYKFARRLQSLRPSRWLHILRGFYRQSSSQRRRFLEHT
jgi:hypothetical protein